MYRMRTISLQEAESKTRMLSSVWNILDFVAFFPPLLELALMYGANLPFRLGRFDLRWFKILRYVKNPISPCFPETNAKGSLGKAWLWPEFGAAMLVPSGQILVLVAY